MAEEQLKKKKGPPFQTLPNKQILPLIGLGTYKLTDELLLTQLLRKGLQFGYCKHIDTARLYNNQIALGKAIKTVINEGRVKREQLFIASKIMNSKHDKVEQQVKEILQLMQLKYLDLLYIHWPFVDFQQSGEFNHKPLEEIWSELQLCVTKGYVKHLGLSNFNGQMISQLLTFCKIKPALLQTEVHPYLPSNSVVDLAQKNGIVVMAHTPLVRGDNLNRGNQVNILKDEVICEIAAKYGRSPAQIIIKSSLQRGVGVIPKTSNPARLQQNFESWSLELSEDDLKKIRALSRGFRVCDGASMFKTFSAFDF